MRSLVHCFRLAPTNTTKTSTKLSVYDPHYSKAGTIVKVSLKDNASNGVSNKKITLTYKGKTYKSTTEENGFAYFKLASMKVGTTMSVTAKFNGDAQYAKKTINSKVKVKTSVVAKNLAETYGDKKAFLATFYKDNDKLTNTTVTFNVNGKKYTVKTNSFGIAKITKEVSDKDSSYNPNDFRNISFLKTQVYVRKSILLYWKK